MVYMDLYLLKDILDKRKEMMESDFEMKLKSRLQFLKKYLNL